MQKLTEKNKLIILISIVSICLLVIILTVINMFSDNKPSDNGELKNEETINKLETEEKQKEIDALLSQIKAKKAEFEKNKQTAEEFRQKTTEMANEVDAIMESSGIKSYNRCIKSSEAKYVFEYVETFNELCDGIDKEIEKIDLTAENIDGKKQLLEELLDTDGYIEKTEEAFEKLTEYFDDFQFGHEGRIEEANEKKEKALSGQKF